MFICDSLICFAIGPAGTEILFGKTAAGDDKTSVELCDNSPGLGFNNVKSL